MFFSCNRSFHLCFVLCMVYFYFWILGKSNESQGLKLFLNTKNWFSFKLPLTWGMTRLYIFDIDHLFILTSLLCRPFWTPCTHNMCPDLIFWYIISMPSFMLANKCVWFYQYLDISPILLGGGAGLGSFEKI